MTAADLPSPETLRHALAAWAGYSGIRPDVRPGAPDRLEQEDLYRAEGWLAHGDASRGPLRSESARCRTATLPEAASSAAMAFADRFPDRTPAMVHEFAAYAKACTDRAIAESDADPEEAAPLLAGLYVLYMAHGKLIEMSKR